MTIEAKKITPILLMFPTSRKTLSFSCSENEPYQEGLR